MIEAGPISRPEEAEMAETARDLMTEGCECVNSGETVADAARKLAQLNVGALPICGEDNKLKGMLTDRDIAIKVVAEGKDPNSVTAGELGEGVPVTVSVDDSADDVLTAMAEHKIRRVPVLDSDKNLVGIISQADVATRSGAAEETGRVVEAISTGS
jgi:CBS domain-containing protein